MSYDDQALCVCDPDVVQDEEPSLQKQKYGEMDASTLIAACSLMVNGGGLGIKFQAADDVILIWWYSKRLNGEEVDHCREDEL
ncbi:hypothetical protein MUK42_32048 [Musa troglodytarum]|uniref:Uncharacterized protein n=1 Tax=Musa troglodytarum TaxID=320322 RepID=A0A9E7H9I8_9LILI|nr:hypothetical protein MUK42_32048 [Musa troglodytarum]